MVLTDLGKSINRALGSLLQNESAIDEEVLSHLSPSLTSCVIGLGHGPERDLQSFIRG
jgi:hypothetical protein